jgi:hypothetical protein
MIAISEYQFKVNRLFTLKGMFEFFINPTSNSLIIHENQKKASINRNAIIVFLLIVEMSE